MRCNPFEETDSIWHSQWPCISQGTHRKSQVCKLSANPPPPGGNPVFSFHNCPIISPLSYNFQSNEIEDNGPDRRLQKAVLVVRKRRPARASLRRPINGHWLAGWMEAALETSEVSWDFENTTRTEGFSLLTYTRSFYKRPGIYIPYHIFRCSGIIWNINSVSGVSLKAFTYICEVSCPQ